MKIQWKNKLHRNRQQILLNGSCVGYLIKRNFCKSTEGVLYGKRYIFINYGFLCQKSMIVDFQNNIIVGEIVFNLLRTTATIEVLFNTYHWRQDNWLNTRATIEYGSEKVAVYNGYTNQGRIITQHEDSVLILTGLFANNYYLQLSIAVLILIKILFFSIMIF